MKYIMTESQYGKLTEQRKSIIERFFEVAYPEIGKLRKRPTKNMKLGQGYKYFDPKTKDVLFHVVSGGPVYWEGGGVTTPVYPGVRLYVESNLYNSLENFIGDFEEELLNWFNMTYKQESDRVIRGIVWW
jgi:hypothetical protein